MERGKDPLVDDATVGDEQVRVGRELRHGPQVVDRRGELRGAAPGEQGAQVRGLHRAGTTARHHEHPFGGERTGQPGDLRYASDLIAFIRELHGDHFHVEVGAYPETHPQAEDALADLRHFKAKVDAGADAAITQYFYNADAYFHFVDAVRALGVEVPIVPGIMPISNFSQLRRFSEQCGAEIPRWIGRKMQALGDDAEAIREFGADVVARLCERLVAGGAPALHFYTLNLARPTQAVLARMQ